MCSVSIFVVNGEIIVTMNRDESVLREKELPPKAHKHGWYPIDSKSGGTWCGLSKNGTAYCLLNRYDDADISPTSSRGNIIPTLMSDEKITDFTPFDSFSLISYGAGKSFLTAWDGKQVKVENISTLPYFFSSSSFKKSEVLPYRKALFDDFVTSTPTPTAENIFALHRTIDQRKEYGIFAEREKSHTKSVLQFVIGKNFHYHYFHRDGEEIKDTL